MNISLPHSRSPGLSPTAAAMSTHPLALLFNLPGDGNQAAKIHDHTSLPDGNSGAPSGGGEPTKSLDCWNLGSCRHTNGPTPLLHQWSLKMPNSRNSRYSGVQAENSGVFAEWGQSASLCSPSLQCWLTQLYRSWCFWTVWGLFDKSKFQNIKILVGVDQIRWVKKRRNDNNNKKAIETN